MKRKPLICLTLVFVIFFSAFLMTTHFIDASSAPILSIVPTGDSGATSTTNIPAQAVGTTFSVDVRVDDYASVNIGGTENGISGASYEVTWDPSVLEYVSYTDGSWLPDQTNAGDLTNKVSSGQLTIGQIAFNTANAMATADSASGSVSATIKLQVLTTGSTTIALMPQKGVSYLVAPETVGGLTSGQSVTGVLTANAQYGPPTTSSSSVHGPTASFTPIDGSTFKLGSSITLNATSSQPGNDTQTCNITNYAWSIEYLNGTTVTSLTGETTAFNAQIVGTFRIILIVTANDVENPPSPSYISTDSTSAIIDVVSNPQSVTIDVFTDKGGIGEGVSSGAYGPLQLVQTYALVESINTVMPEESVMFTIIDPNGTSFYRQGVTNATGIAIIQPSFRLPGPNFGSSQTSFGTWTIIASVNILGVTANDTTSFTLNFLNGIENVTIPADIHRNESLPIQLTINNKDLSAESIQLSITLFDQAGIPMANSVIAITQQSQNVTVIDAAITIPAWAFTGQATAYFCLTTNSTNIPLAPEGVATFNILS